MTRNYRSDAHAAIHETMQGMCNAGVISQQTMRTFDKLNLEEIHPMDSNRIRLLRKRERMSQPVFARYLNVSKNLVSDWERGVKKPSGPALKLLTVVEKKGIQAIS